jgi:cell division protein FtsB
MSVSSLAIASSLPQRRSASKGNALLIFFVLLLLVSLVAQVYLSGVTIETKHQAEITKDEAASLERNSADLENQLAQQLNPQAVEKFAMEKLGMKYVHSVDSNAGIVYLTGQDFSSFAQATPLPAHVDQP